MGSASSAGASAAGQGARSGSSGSSGKSKATKNLSKEAALGAALAKSKALQASHNRMMTNAYARKGLKVPSSMLSAALIATSKAEMAGIKKAEVTKVPVKVPVQEPIKSPENIALELAKEEKHTLAPDTVSISISAVQAGLEAVSMGNSEAEGIPTFVMEPIIVTAPRMTSVETLMAKIDNYMTELVQGFTAWAVKNTYTHVNNFVDNKFVSGTISINVGIYTAVAVSGAIALTGQIAQGIKDIVDELNSLPAVKVPEAVKDYAEKEMGLEK